MEKQNIFTWWLIVLFVEIIWLYVTIQNVHDTSELVFMVALIGVTIAVGAVGITIFGISKR
ncbi:hypothetical protein [Bacillus suaedae]|uniref:Uncharacterized protein n=1 Tax=Halalkalibacter suaedae TaxID=2822140 RepID=A0A940WS79_9BACI|nr:hypothetical protein [Bacillus suaedae]MBP3951754.1 hypothetical protein [Bacillus suaedae]